MALPSALKNLGRILSINTKLAPKCIRNYQGQGFSEPDYLDALKPQFPVYDLLNIQLKSYDFPALERYGSYVHRTAEYFGLNVEQSWATAPQVLQVRTYKPESKIVDKEYKLYHYERNIQISDFPCTLAPIFLEVIHSNLPEGTQLNVHPHQEEHEEIRYIPDIELNDLKEKLDEMRNPNANTKKK